MYCQTCGKELSADDAYCPKCGAKVGTVADSQYSPGTGTAPKEPDTLIPFILGLLLSVIGVLIAVLVYNGNDGPYTKNPTTHALVWSLIGTCVSAVLSIALFFAFFAAIMRAGHRPPLRIPGRRAPHPNPIPT